MSTLRLILGDQLSFKISSLEKADPSKDIIMMSELLGEKAYAKNTKSRLSFYFLLCVTLLEI